MVAAPMHFSILLLLGLGGFGMPSDLLSLVDPDAYFRAREVPVTVAKMLELAGKQPTDAKGEVAQLLAIRMLGEEPDEVQKEKEAIIKVLQPLAEGKQTGDKHGFVRTYARRTLDRLGVKDGQTSEPTAQDKLIDVFNWFPDKTGFVAGGLNAARDDSKDNPLRAMLKSNARPEDFEQLYKFAEAVGNVRLDGFAFGYAFEGQQPTKGRIYIRVRGAANHERLLAFIRKTEAQGSTFKEEKGPRGERLTFITQKEFGPALALVGDTDAIMAMRTDHPVSDTAVIEEMLKVRAGEQPSILKGVLGEDLKKLPPQVVGLMLGDVPQEVRQMILAVGPFRAFPHHLQIELARGKSGDLDVRLRGKLAGANEAKLFAEDMSSLRKKGIEALKNPPPPPPGVKLPPRTFEMMRSSLESLKLEPTDMTVTGGMQVSRELFSVLPMAFFAPYRVEGPMPPNAPKAAPVPGNK